MAGSKRPLRPPDPNVPGLTRLHPTRRQVLLLAIAAGLAPIADTLVARAETAGANPVTLDAFLDVLLPADALSPAASALGVGAGILDLATDSPLFARLLAAGCNWLDGLDPRGFAGLPADTQTNVVTFMTRADPNEVPRRFYHLTRQIAVELYFAHPAAIAGYALAAAPQPAGYPPPWT